MRKRIVAGNWKMNMNNSEAQTLFESLNNTKIVSSIEIIIAPPSLYLSEFASKKGKQIYLAAQNCSDMRMVLIRVKSLPPCYVLLVLNIV